MTAQDPRPGVVPSAFGGPEKVSGRAGKASRGAEPSLPLMMATAMGREERVLVLDVDSRQQSLANWPGTGQ
ncbi:hypothetical protein GCM10020000_85030 [Streptomyces olivoverticillatus]